MGTPKTRRRKPGVEPIKKNQKEKRYVSRYDAYIGDCSVFVLDRRPVKLDIVLESYLLVYFPDGSSNRDELVRKARIKCARLNREDYLAHREEFLSGLQETDSDA